MISSSAIIHELDRSCTTIYKYENAFLSTEARRLPNNAMENDVSKSHILSSCGAPSPDGALREKTKIRRKSRIRMYACVYYIEYIDVQL